MSTISHESLANHHSLGLFAQLNAILKVWRDRRRQRFELAQWTDRDLHDVGLSWSDIVQEAEKPFWQA